MAYPGISGAYMGQPQQAPAQQFPGQGYSGFGAPQVDPNIAAWFHAVDRDRSGRISPIELQQALVNGNWTHFTTEACRLMIALFDRDRSGTIDVFEFQQLFLCITQWKAVFESYDRDRSGGIEHAELMQAFTQLGYRLSPQFIQHLINKNDIKGKKKLTLDNFIVAMTQVRILTDAFRMRDREMRGVITVGYEDFLTVAIGCTP